MKKLFTLAIALLVAFAGYSQVRQTISKDFKAATMKKAARMEASFENVQSQPNMTRTAGELDYTTYDWQSNSGARTWTINWPDGKVSFAYTVASDESFSDRGTGIGTYDPVADEWIPLGGRIENEKTGFGSIARYRDNGIVVAAHTATDLKVFIVEDKDNMTPNSVPAIYNAGKDWYSHPAVMTSGPNRDIIHMVAAEFSGDSDGDGITNGIRYWRSLDGGQTWDKQESVLPFLTIEYGIEHGTNSYYFMETTDDNCLALVINTGNTDGMVLYSYDNGDTWERKVYFHDPAPGVLLDNSFVYPRWTSAQWNSNKELMMAYEFNFSDHQGHYGPSLGGVAFWSEYMPYYGDGSSFNQWGVDPTNPVPPVQGQPFIMDSAYLFQDIYASWWLWSDASHDMWPEYFGYLTTLDENGNWEDPYTATEFNIEDRGLHGSYNSGICAFPVLCKVGNSDYDLVTVWSAMDENNTDNNNKFYYKLFASYSGDGGMTWSTMKHLTNDFMYQYSECVYPQATVIGNTLVIAAQLDATADAYVMSVGSGATGQDLESSDCYYQGFTFDLNELFPDAGVNVPENNTVKMTIYPNPAVDQLNVNLSQGADIVIFNVMGQAVRTVEGHVGANTVDLSGLTSGVYFVNAGSNTQKFIVK
ncbi:MAG: T9SS type A sorting domain-containing protein [Bacteroidales bacterium]|nr:T9SS type A sorting domain-containing protein [Bacteroidales bacterium]